MASGTSAPVRATPLVHKLHSDLGAVTELLAAVRNPLAQTTASKVLFGDFAVSLLDRKVKRGDVKSAKTRRL